MSRPSPSREERSTESRTGTVPGRWGDLSVPIPPAAGRPPPLQAEQTSDSEGYWTYPHSPFARAKQSSLTPFPPRPDPFPRRVRHHNHLARIEVPAEHVARLAEPETRRRILEHFRAAGYNYVTLDLQGFRSGSMNEVIAFAKARRLPSP